MNQNIGVFFTIGRKKFVTYMNYRGKSKFKQLLDEFAENANIYEPQENDKFTYVDLKVFLEFAYENLKDKHKAKNIITSLLAINDIYELVY